MARFRNAGEGAIGAYFEPEEVRVLAGLVQEMSSVLDSGSKTGDPITERLFPPRTKILRSSGPTRSYSAIS
jgi:hypothetical protein